MSFTWPNEPTAGAKQSDFADYAELLCLQSGICSFTKISCDIGRLEENNYENGVQEYSRLDEDIELAFKEIERRQVACSEENYPFNISPTGRSIKISSTLTSAHILYCYLLLATRLNMKTDRNHGDIDGTLLFEHVSAAIAASFWGSRSDSMVFGTASEGSFEAKIEELCQRLGEGECFINRNTGAVTQNDGKLDVVVWKGFSDCRQGKLIGFGQCKTGRNWRDQLTQLQPDIFCSSWMRDTPPVKPVRLFFVAESVGNEQWYTQISNGGLIFDRCRILDYFSDEMSDSTTQDVKKWLLSATTTRELNYIANILNT